MTDPAIFPELVLDPVVVEDFEKQIRAAFTFAGVEPIVAPRQIAESTICASLARGEADERISELVKARYYPPSIFVMEINGQRILLPAVKPISEAEEYDLTNRYFCDKWDAIRDRADPQDRAIMDYLVEMDEAGERGEPVWNRFSDAIYDIADQFHGSGYSPRINGEEDPYDNGPLRKAIDAFACAMTQARIDAGRYSEDADRELDRLQSEYNNWRDGKRIAPPRVRPELLQALSEARAVPRVVLEFGGRRYEMSAGGPSTLPRFTAVSHWGIEKSSQPQQTSAVAPPVAASRPLETATADGGNSQPAQKTVQPDIDGQFYSVVAAWRFFDYRLSQAAIRKAASRTNKKTKTVPLPSIGKGGQLMFRLEDLVNYRTHHLRGRRVTSRK